jgi:hypothetical protein
MIVAPGQTTAGSSTLNVSVTDPSGAVIPGATVTLHNPVTAYEKTATTDANGVAHFAAIPQNKYHVEVTSNGFQSAAQDVVLRSTVPVNITVALQLASEATTVEVHAEGADVVESVPMAHTEISGNLVSQLPVQSVGQGVTDVLALSVPGVVKDSDGFIHPLGDHSDTQYSVDNQPITNQQNKQASNQMPLNAIQTFDAISGAPPPEYGDKASLVVTAVTKSGLNAPKPFGSVSLGYGSFGTATENFSFGDGNARLGNFFTANSSRSGRYLDSPEFRPLHDTGNNEQFFDRFDYQPTQADTVHLNLFVARSWFQIPNTYDQQAAGQDQRQQVGTINIAPGWTHLVSPSSVLTVSPYFREDHVQYFPSRDPFSDLPATVSQDRRLATTGVNADISYLKGIHNAKAGIQISHNIMTENFGLGVTDPGFNAPCLDAAGNPVICSTAGSVVNPNFQPGLLPFDLTRGGMPLRFHGHADIKEYGFFAQDTITVGGFTIMGGLRGDLYRGLVADNAIEPRVGISYLYKPTSTVFRASYSRFFETPYNENLVLSSSTGIGGLQANALGAFGESPLRPGRRNQYQTGFQQGFGKHVVAEANYFWKYTDRAYDFDTLFNTPIAFPIEWRKSKIDGVEARVTLADINGFRAYTAMGHTRARFFGPEVGGLIFNSPVNVGAFRIDHDEAFEQSTNLRYQHGKNGLWASFTWRYDSGLVAGDVPDLATALALTADQQHAIGFFCGGVHATLSMPITSCSSPNYGAERLRIPAAGTYNPDTNPPRIAPRNLFDIGLGTDDLFHTDKVKWTLQLTAVNITNEVALYNFLSTFSGTHFVTPRAYTVNLGFNF